MTESVKLEIQPGQDAFVDDLRKQKFIVEQKLAGIKSEFHKLDSEQRRLGTLIAAEKQQTSGGKNHKKSKGHNKNKVVRLDIVKNEQKFQEQVGKIALMRKEMHHLEMELKGLVHDLAVVEQSH